jgi:hypothetical protein
VECTGQNTKALSLYHEDITWPQARLEQQAIILHNLAAS